MKNNALLLCGVFVFFVCFFGVFGVFFALCAFSSQNKYIEYNKQKIAIVVFVCWNLVYSIAGKI